MNTDLFSHYKFAGLGLAVVVVLSMITKPAKTITNFASRSNKDLINKVNVYKTASGEADNDMDALVHINFALAYFKLIDPDSGPPNTNLRDLQIELETRQTVLIKQIQPSASYGIRAPI
jgi:hypothetical protein